MYFQSMSLGLGVEGRAAMDAIDACDRMLRRLDDSIERHDRVAERARPDWDGPHRTEFDGRFERAQYQLRSAEAWVLHLRWRASEVLANAHEEVREAVAAATRSLPSW